MYVARRGVSIAGDGFCLALSARRRASTWSGVGVWHVASEVHATSTDLNALHAGSGPCHLVMPYASKYLLMP